MRPTNKAGQEEARPWVWLRDAEGGQLWSLPDGQLPLYKARDKVSKDLVALKMVKMEPGERVPRNSFPTPTSPYLLGQGSCP